MEGNPAPRERRKSSHVVWTDVDKNTSFVAILFSRKNIRFLSIFTVEYRVEKFSFEI